MSEELKPLDLLNKKLLMALGLSEELSSELIEQQQELSRYKSLAERREADVIYMQRLAADNHALACKMAEALRLLVEEVSIADNAHAYDNLTQANEALSLALEMGVGK